MAQCQDTLDQTRTELQNVQIARKLAAAFLATFTPEEATRVPATEQARLQGQIGLLAQEHSNNPGRITALGRTEATLTDTVAQLKKASAQNARLRTVCERCLAEQAAEVGNLNRANADLTNRLTTQGEEMARLADQQTEAENALTTTRGRLARE